MKSSTHLLLVLTADSHAPALVEHAWQLITSRGGTWSVVAIESHEKGQLSDAHRSSLVTALERAVKLGAEVSSLRTGTDTPNGVASALACRVRSANATALMFDQGWHQGLAWSQSEHGLTEFTGILARLLPHVTLHTVSMSGKPHRLAHGQFSGRWLEHRARDWLPVLFILCMSTLIGVVLEFFLHPVNLVMIYMAGVAYVASRSGRAPATVMIIGSIVLYDLIFVAPRWSLKPTDPQHWLAFVVMMVVGLLISQLAAQSREQAVLAEARAQRAQALNQLSVALGRARDARAVAQELCSSVRASIGVPAAVVRFEDRTLIDLYGGQLPVGFRSDLALEALLSGNEADVETLQYAGARAQYIPLRAGAESFGVLAIGASSDDHRDTVEDQQLIRAFASQAEVAFERAVLEQRSIQAAIETECERTRNTLLSGISHDFRTPLTTIIGSATTLIEQSGAIDGIHRQALLRGLLAEAQRLHLLTSNLLDLTRMDEGAIQPKLEWCPADELIEEALTGLQVNLEPLRLEVAVEHDQVVWCDPRLVGQALVNLLDNAIRHSASQGRVSVRVTTNHETWSLIVHDQGSGVPAGHEKAIFQKFYRADEHGDSSGKGLGLAICAAVAALHKGNIHVINDSGARFVMTLPQPELTAMAQGDLE